MGRRADHHGDALAARPRGRRRDPRRRDDAGGARAAAAPQPQRPQEPARQRRDGVVEQVVDGVRVAPRVRGPEPGVGGGLDQLPGRAEGEHGARGHDPRAGERPAGAAGGRDHGAEAHERREEDRAREQRQDQVGAVVPARDDLVDPQRRAGPLDRQREHEGQLERRRWARPPRAQGRHQDEQRLQRGRRVPGRQRSGSGDGDGDPGRVGGEPHATHRALLPVGSRRRRSRRTVR